jgi:hypothetical protein
VRDVVTAARESTAAQPPGPHPTTLPGGRPPYPLGSRLELFVDRELIEHVADVVALMGEVHRICTPGAIVTVQTPHFSSIHSYTDPGHRQRLACGSMDQVRKDLGPDRPLEVLRKEILFHDGFWSWPSRLISRISTNKYEKFFAFLFPARELVFELRIVKDRAESPAHCGMRNETSRGGGGAEGRRRNAEGRRQGGRGTGDTGKRGAGGHEP